MNLFGLFGPPVPSVGPAGAQQLVSEGWSLLDVREPHEFRSARISGARHIPLGRLGREAAELAGKRWVVVCRSGNRSRAATAALIRAGVEARNLKGGMLAWQAASLPVVTGGRS